MPLRQDLEHILQGYLQAKTETFTQHPLANFIRRNFRETVESLIGDQFDVDVKASPGMGNWSAGPWLGLFSPLVTSGAQSGFYPVYLFREDMAGVYLSLNQGMTQAKEEYRSDAKTALKARAANFRAILGNQAAAFTELTIDLAPATPQNDTAFYEAGNILAKYYPAGQMPSGSSLTDDLFKMLQLYQALIEGDSGSGLAILAEGDEPATLHYEDASKFRLHKRIERNSKLSKDVKKHLGYTCQVCNTNFEKTYGELGKEYIEAHHLKPIAGLTGKVAMDPLKDFAVLCANCHRMVHRSGLVDDIERFKKEHYHG